MKRFAAAFALHAVLSVPVCARADAYRWVDAAGIVHMTQDSARVPADQRLGARIDASRALAKLSTYEAPTSSSKRHAISFEQEGQLMRVMVRLDDRLTVPFYLDTGATDVVLPESVAKHLGIVPDRNNEVLLQTPAGRVRVPTLQLTSIRVGTAQVSNLRATVAPALEVGLLGGAFLNQFRYSIDPDTKTLTLERRADRSAEAAKF